MTPGQAAYREYLKSDHWRGLRMEAFAKYGRRCACCPATCRLDVHHLLYRRPWESGMVEDLKILCRTCHEKAHGIGLFALVPCKDKERIQRLNKWRRQRAKNLVPKWMSKRRGSKGRKLSRLQKARNQMRQSRRSRYQWSC